MMKKLRLGLVSLSTLALLAACGDQTPVENAADTDDQVTEDLNVPAEQPQDGATDDIGEDGASGQDDPSRTPVDTANGIYDVDFDVSLEDALQTFYDTFGEDVNIDEIELDEDNGVYEYSISGWDDQNDYDIDINAETGEIVQQETDRDTDTDEDIITIDNLITPREAMEIATQEAGTDVVEGWKIEVDDGMTVYEIDLDGTMDDITINAETGDIVDR